MAVGFLYIIGLISAFCRRKKLLYFPPHKTYFFCETYPKQSSYLLAPDSVKTKAQKYLVEYRAGIITCLDL